MTKPAPLPPPAKFSLSSWVLTALLMVYLLAAGVAFYRPEAQSYVFSMPGSTRRYYVIEIAPYNLTMISLLLGTFCTIPLAWQWFSGKRVLRHHVIAYCIATALTIFSGFINF